MRIITVFFVSFLLLLVSGCNSEQKSINTYPDNLPSFSQSLENIIVKYDKVENKERFDEFLNNVHQGKDDHIRVVKYTTEGAPILYDYEFENDVINVTIDTRRDSYGQRKIIHKTCTSIKVNEETEKTSYELVDCTPIGDIIILTIDEK